MHLRLKTETTEQLMQVQLPKCREELAILLRPKSLAEVCRSRSIVRAGEPLEPVIEKITNAAAGGIVNPLKEAIVAFVRPYGLRVTASNIGKQQRRTNGHGA